MADIDEQRKRVEELKRKIIEQKKKSEPASPLDQAPEKPAVEGKPQPAPAQNQPREVKQQAQVESPQRKEEVIDNAKKISPPRQEEQKQRAEPEKSPPARNAVPIIYLQAYAQALKQAWANGSVSKDEENLLASLRNTMGISEEEHTSLELEARLDIYLQAIIDCWKNGSITPQDFDRLDTLRERFNISAEEHMRLEKQVRQEILRQH